MKIMFFCWAQEMQTEMVYVAKYLSQLQQHFIVTPLIKLKDKTNFDETISKLSESSKNITVAPVYLKSPNSKFSNLLNPNILMRDFLSILKVIKRSKPDVIVCFYVSHAYPLALLKSLSKFSLCIVAMGSDVNLENGFLQKIAKEFVYRNSDLVFARSWKLKEKIEEAHKCSVTVNPSSTDTAFFRPLDSKVKLREKWNIDLNAQVVLTVCRLDKNKGVDVLLKSIATLKNDKVKVLIVGDGVERNALDDLSATLGLQEKVTFMGLRNRVELLELYNLSDVFALTSYSEGLPRVLIEAMACGCIPVATDVGSVSALVTNGCNGFTTVPGNHRELSEKIKKVLSMPEEKLKLMQTKARQSVIEDFDSQKMWKLMVETINVSILINN